VPSIPSPVLMLMVLAVAVAYPDATLPCDERGDPI
jgi:hypothetical protein